METLNKNKKNENANTNIDELIGNGVIDAGNENSETNIDELIGGSITDIGGATLSPSNTGLEEPSDNSGDIDSLIGGGLISNSAPGNADDFFKAYSEEMPLGLLDTPARSLLRRTAFEHQDLNNLSYPEMIEISNEAQAGAALGPFFGRYLTSTSATGGKSLLAKGLEHIVKAYGTGRMIEKEVKGIFTDWTPTNKVEKVIYKTPLGLAYNFAKHLSNIYNKAIEIGGPVGGVYIIGGLMYDGIKTGLDILSLPLVAIMKAEASQIRKIYPNVKANPESLGWAKAQMMKELINEFGGILFPESSYAITGQRYGLGDWLWEKTGKLKDGVVRAIERSIETIHQSKELAKNVAGVFTRTFGIDPKWSGNLIPIAQMTAAEKLLGAAKWAVEHATLKDVATIWTMFAEDPLTYISFGSAPILEKAKPVIESLAAKGITPEMGDVIAKAIYKYGDDFKRLLLEGKTANVDKKLVEMIEAGVKPVAKYEGVSNYLKNILGKMKVSGQNIEMVEIGYPAATANWELLDTLADIIRTNPEAFDAFAEIVRTVGGRDPLMMSLKELGQHKLYGFRIAGKVIPYSDFLNSKSKTLIDVFYASVGMATHDINKILRESNIDMRDKDTVRRIRMVLLAIKQRLRNLHMQGWEEVDNLREAIADMANTVRNAAKKYGVPDEDANFVFTTVIQRFIGASPTDTWELFEKYLQTGKIPEEVLNAPSLTVLKNFMKGRGNTLEETVQYLTEGGSRLQLEIAKKYYNTFTREEMRQFLSDPEVRKGMETIKEIFDRVLKLQVDPDNIFVRGIKLELDELERAIVEGGGEISQEMFRRLIRTKGFRSPYLYYFYNMIYPISKKKLGSLPYRVRRQLGSFLVSIFDKSWNKRNLVFPVDPFNEAVLQVLYNRKIISESTLKKLGELSMRAIHDESAEKDAFRIVTNALQRFIKTDEAAKDIIMDLEKHGFVYYPTVHEIDIAAKSGFLFGKPVEGFIETNPFVAAEQRILNAAKEFSKTKVAFEIKKKLLQAGWAIPLDSNPKKAMQQLKVLNSSEKLSFPIWERGIGPWRDIAIPIPINTAIKKYINYFLTPNPHKRLFGQAFAKMTVWWKRMMTIYFPGFHARNMTTNWILAEMNGIPLITTRDGHRAMWYGMKALMKARGVKDEEILTALKKASKDKHITKLLDIFGIGEEELRTAGSAKLDLGQLVYEIKKNNVLGNWVTTELGGKSDPITKIGLTVGEVVEGHARVSSYIYLRMKGYSEEAATEIVGKTFYNYDELPRIVKQMRDTVVPFASWYYFTLLGPNNIFKLIRRNPRWLLYPERIKQYLEWKFRVNPLKLPDSYWDSFGIPLGLSYQYENGDRQPVIKMAYFGSYLPQTNINMIFHPFKTLADMLHPVLRYPLEAVAGKRFFSGKDIELYGEKKRKILGISVPETVEHFINTAFRAPREISRFSTALGLQGEPAGELTTSDRLLNIVKLTLGLNTYAVMANGVLGSRIYHVRQNLQVLRRQYKKAISKGDEKEAEKLGRQIEELELWLEQLEDQYGWLYR